MIAYSYNLGLSVDGTQIPDPKTFSGSVSDLDTSAERDSTGKLHRAWVAQKEPIDISYECIGWDMATEILSALNKPSFTFTFFDPNIGSIRSGTYYVGDRKWNAVIMSGDTSTWITSLSFSVIEY